MTYMKIPQKPTEYSQYTSKRIQKLSHLSEGQKAELLKEMTLSDDELKANPSPAKVEKNRVVEDSSVYNPEHEQAFRKDMLEDITSYNIPNDEEIQEITKILKEKWIHVINLNRAMNIWGKIIGGGIKFNGLAIGKFVSVRDNTKIYPTAIHEAIHGKQYEDYKPNKGITWMILGLSRFWNEWNKEIKEMKETYKDFGEDYVSFITADNQSIDREAYLHQWDTKYLTTRKKFAQKKYTTPEWRMNAVKYLLWEEINIRMKKIESLIEKGDTMTEQEVAIINIIIDELTEDIEKVEKIIQKYGNNDRALIAFRDNEDKINVWQESEINQKKFGEMIKEDVKKELQIKNILDKKYKKNIRYMSPWKNFNNGLLKLIPKDWNFEAMVQTLSNDKEISLYTPSIQIKYIRNPQTGVEDKTQSSYIGISFVE